MYVQLCCGGTVTVAINTYIQAYLISLIRYLLVINLAKILNLQKSSVLFTNLIQQTFDTCTCTYPQPCTHTKSWHETSALIVQDKSIICPKLRAQHKSFVVIWSAKMLTLFLKIYLIFEPSIALF